MKKTIITLIVAIALMLGGGLMMLISLSVMGDSWKNVNPGTEKTDTVSLSVSSLDVDVWDVAVEILPSPDGNCTVTRTENEKFSYSVTVENETLVIRRNDLRKWYERWNLFSFDTPSLTVRLPEKNYKTLNVKSRSCGVLVEEGLTFEKAAISVTSGKIRYYADAKDELILSSTSGGLEVKNVSAKVIQGSVTSGSLLVENVTAHGLTFSAVSGSSTVKNAAVSEDFSLKGSSGSVTLENVVCGGNLSVKNTSSSILLNRCDGKNITIKSVSGSVKGTVLTEKIFLAKSSSGSVNVPDSVPDGGFCEIETTSGSIHISLAE